MMERKPVTEVCEVAEFQFTVICPPTPSPSHYIGANNLTPSPKSALSVYFVNQYE